MRRFRITRLNSHEMRIPSTRRIEKYKAITTIGGMVSACWKRSAQEKLPLVNNGLYTQGLPI